MNFSFIKNKIFLIFIATIFSIFLSKILWLKINIPLNDQSKVLNIVGAYTKANYNPINEILRYLTFICIPLLVFFISINFFFKNNLVKLKKIIFYNDFTYTEKIKSNFKLYFLLAVVFIISILEFTSNDFPAGKIDILHEGQRMIAAINYIANEGLWLSSFMTVGIFYEVLQTLIGFNLFDNQTIGSSRIIAVFLNLFTKLSLIYLIYQISKASFLIEKEKSIFFLFTSLLIITFTLKNIDWRDFPLLIFLNCLAFIFTSKKKLLYINFLIGLLSVISFIWSVERGAYLNFTLLILLSLFLIRKNYTNLFLILGGIAVGWIIFYLIIGRQEFIQFYNNTKEIFLYMEYTHGWIHPTPFSSDDNAARATKTLISIIFSGILVLQLIFFKNKIFTNKFKIFYVFLFILSVISYRNALGLSDSIHIRHSSVFPEILIITLLVYYSINILSKNKFLYNLINKNLSINVISMFLLLLLLNNEKIDIGKTINFGERIKIYVSQTDNYFLSDSQKKMVGELEDLLGNEKCINMFTESCLLPYLLKKPTCNKFYLTYGGLITETHQKQYVKELKKNRSKYIILDNANHFPYNELPDIFQPLYKFPIIGKYINSKYFLIKEINSISVYQLKNL